MRRALSTLGGAGLAVCLSQFPEYAQQYVQRLGGAVDELRIVVEDFDRGAAQFGLSRDEAIARFETSTDGFLKNRGESAQYTFARYEELSATLARVQDATPLERLQMLPQFLDSEIGGRTLDNFKPAVPVTTEGLLWGGAGLLIGYALVSIIVSFVTLPFRRRRVVYRDRVPAQPAEIDPGRKRLALRAGEEKPIRPEARPSVPQARVEPGP